MTSNRESESYKAMKCSEKIIIFANASDLCGMFDTYSCLIYDNRGAETVIYINVDHLKKRITLEKSGFSQSDILAVLNGNTATLESMNIQSCDGKTIGRFHHYTIIVGDVKHSTIMECLSLPAGCGQFGEEAIIRDPRTAVILAQLVRGYTSDLREVTTIFFKSQTGLDPVTKILTLLLAFKTFKARARPQKIIPSMNYRKLDDLASLQEVSITKALYVLGKGGTKYNYFNVMDVAQKNNLLTIEVSGYGDDGFRLKLVNRHGNVLISAKPLCKFEYKTIVHLGEAHEIGYVERYKLHFKHLSDCQTHLESSTIKNPNNPNCVMRYDIRRQFTKQRIAIITPNQSKFPRQMIVNIHPAVDTVHKALILIFAMKLNFTFFRFFTDKVTKSKVNLPKAYFTHHTDINQNDFLNNRLFHATQQASTVQRNQDYQTMHAAEGADADQGNQDDQAMDFADETYKSGKQRSPANIPAAAAVPSPADTTSSQHAVPPSIDCTLGNRMSSLVFKYFT